MKNYLDFIKDIPMPLLYVRLITEEDRTVDYKVEFANEQMSNILKMKQEEVINKSIIEAFNIEKYYNELVNINKEGVIRIYIPNLRAFYKIKFQRVDENHGVFYFIELLNLYKGIVSEIKKTDKIVFIKDKYGVYVDCNENFKNILNFKVEDIFNKSDKDLWHEPLANAFIKSHRNFLLDKSICVETMCNLDNVYYSIKRYGIYDEDELVSVLGVCEVVSDIKLEREKINNTKKLMQIVEESIPDNIFYRDINGVYLDCNKSFADDIGVDKKDIIGKTSKEIEPLKHLAESFMKTDCEVISSKERKIYEEEFIVNGEIKYNETIKSPFLDSYNNVAGVVGITRDISHRKEMDKEIDRLRLEFFANLSHELRTPINLIFSALQLIKMKEKDNLKDNQILNKYINIIGQNGNRLLKLVNNLIDLTKIDCGYFEYKPQNANIINFIEDICMSVADFAKQNNIELIFDTNIEEKIIAFDLEKVERIMLNLLSNSIKYNSNPGKISVMLDSDDKVFEISVEDTGIGIPQGKLGDIFQKFTQVENRFTKISEGSGIGLSLTQSLVEIQGGTIEVESELGKGSKFIVKLPCKLVEVDEYTNYNKKIDNELVERMNIEFSDIY